MDFTKLKNFMDFMVREKTPSNAIEVYLDSKPVFKYATGYSSLENKEKLTGYEYFNIYSCSKIATVTAGMQILEQGKFLLSDPLYEYIPEFREMYVKSEDGIKKAQNIITIGDLFTMTAGFNYDINVPAFNEARQKTEGRMDTLETIKCLAKEPLSFEPGTRWGYSLCHDVLAAVIEVVSGMKFRDYMKENIFKPLGMNKTVYHSTSQIKEGMAEQYSFVATDSKESDDIVELQRSGNAKAGVFKNVGKDVAHILGCEYDSGGAGITTTTADYVKLVAALANGGMGINGERILSEYAVELMKVNRLNDTVIKYFNWSQLKGYGYGLGVRTHIKPELSGCMSNIGEFGWNGAAGAAAIVDTKAKLAVFYTQHCLNPREEFYMPRLKNIVYSCL